jgi:hypothetical protein
MNKTSFIAILLVSTFISCHAQKSEVRTITAFDHLKISGAVNVIYTNSDSLNLTVMGKENELDNIETKIENSTLIISSKGKTHSDLYVYIKNNQLTNIESSGASSLKTTNTLKSDSMLLNVSGASDIRLKVETKKIKCLEVGASNVVLEGTTDYMDAEISGAASLKSYNLIVKDALLSTSGAASAKVNVTERLKATATSASDIKIKGDPKDVTVETSTAANITRIKGLSKDDEKSDSDTTFFNMKRRKIMVVENSEVVHVNSSKDNDDDFKHWSGIYLGITGYMNANGGTTLPDKYQYMNLDYRKSFNLQANIVERQFDLVRNNFKLIVGLGLNYHLYEFDNKTRLNADSSFTWGVIDSSGAYSYKRNRLSCSYIQVPLLLEFNTSNNPEKTFHMAFGVIGEFLLGGKSKQILNQGKDRTTKIRKDNYNMNPFIAKAHVNLGYRNWTFYGEYNLTQLFQSGKGPELYPFSAGIRLIPFS